jgi:putative transferase (TIGR04331 family)
MFAEDGLKYLKFQDVFFNNLRPTVIKKVHFRSYPNEEKSKYLVYDENEFLYKYFDKFKFIDDFKFSCKNLMNKSKLVVLSYISTGLIEGLLMNIPVIAFWNKNSLYLDNEYLTFFDSLVEVGILQTSPEGASNFVNTIINNPEEWWLSQKVQESREKFLEINIGDPNFLFEYILKLNKN